MADRRPELDDLRQTKRLKTEDLDPRANPYLAHRYEEPTKDISYSNGYGKPSNQKNGVESALILADFPRHATNALMANKAEDGPNNPFNGKPLSTQYFNILKTRRNLPVHAQRFVALGGSREPII